MEHIERTKRMNEIFFNICKTAAENPKQFVDNDLETDRIRVLCEANHELIINTLLLIFICHMLFYLPASFIIFITKLFRR